MTSSAPRCEQRHANPLENDYLDRGVDLVLSGVGLVLSRGRWWSSPSHTPGALAHHQRLVCDVLGYCGVPSHGVAREKISRCTYFSPRSIHGRIARYDRRAHCRRNRAPQAFFASIIRDPLVATGVRAHPEVKTIVRNSAMVISDVPLSLFLSLFHGSRSRIVLHDGELTWDGLSTYLVARLQRM